MLKSSATLGSPLSQVGVHNQARTAEHHPRLQEGTHLADARVGACYEDVHLHTRQVGVVLMLQRIAARRGCPCSTECQGWNELLALLVRASALHSSADKACK